MNLKNFTFVIAIAGLLVTSCSPQSIDEHTTEDNIQNGQTTNTTTTTNIDKGEIIVPTNG